MNAPADPSFQTAIERGDVEALKAMPPADIDDAYLTANPWVIWDKGCRKARAIVGVLGAERVRRLFAWHTCIDWAIGAGTPEFVLELFDVKREDALCSIHMLTPDTRATRVIGAYFKLTPQELRDARYQTDPTPTH
tara:strand:+ start:24 stop:431 length:408 start_codon:yes stop_codon:yes gene_type:complete